MGPHQAAYCSTRRNSWVLKNILVLYETGPLVPFTGYSLASLIIKFIKIFAYTSNVYISNIVPPIFQQEYIVNYIISNGGDPERCGRKLAKNS